MYKCYESECEYRFLNLIIYHFFKLTCTKKKGEDFKEAKRLNLTIKELYVIGQQLARLDTDKRAALANEDYARAELKKNQINQYRTETFKQLYNANLLGYIDVIYNFT